MPSLPPIPDVTDDQFAYLIDVFTTLAGEWGLAGPAEAYVHWVQMQLVALVRSHAIDQVQTELDEHRQTSMAEVEAMLADLISGA